MKIKTTKKKTKYIWTEDEMMAFRLMFGPMQEYQIKQYMRECAKDNRIEFPKERIQKFYDLLSEIFMQYRDIERASRSN